MSRPPGMREQSIAPTYEPSSVEEKWYSFWESKGCFSARSTSPGKSFCIVIPPPNITGSLHLGHALNNTLQDILVRYKRMDGFNALWLPGTDHAGIATQNVVERDIAAEGLTRHAVGREEFLKRVWAWKERYGRAIIMQLKRLGCSCDWTRERFTLDEGLSRVVREVFVRLYSEGLIYRGNYLINWCPRCLTALSDLEVVQAEEDGSLVSIAYPLKDRDGEVVVATTRPETLLGDTAVAVHPGDRRYADLVGKTALLPIIGRPIPIIADAQVDPEFGTGAVKITPGHDFKDFEISKTHSLPAVSILNDQGHIVQDSALGSYAGADRFEARRLIINDLRDRGLFRGTTPYRVALGRCYRCQTITEPMLKPQWFVRTKPLAEPAIRAVKEGKMQFIPSHWGASYFQWMENIRDWCISRQIWWGHRIPAWHCDACGRVTVSVNDPAVCSHCSGPAIRRDPDVLDTWFSSALWPFSTLGWPEKTQDFLTFYPTSVLVTSHDIIFFWVARMMMMGIKFTGTVPFRHVYIHALVRDIYGKKMSKSRGNVIDPLFLMDKYGTDALRFTLTALAAQGRDIKISEDRVAGYRNFATKIWNSVRFALMNLDGELSPPEIDEGLLSPTGERPQGLSLADKWILTRFTGLVSQIRSSLDAYQFDEAGRALYGFFWHEFCDWYLEMAKPALKGGPETGAACRWTLLRVLEGSMRLLHPFMPFLTEEVWQMLPIPREPGTSIMTAPFPDPDRGLDFPEAADMDNVIEAISLIRNIRGEINVSPSLRPDVFIHTSHSTVQRVFEDNRPHILALAKGSSLTVTTVPPRLDGPAASGKGKDFVVYVSLAGVDIAAEIARLEKNMKKTEEDLRVLDAKITTMIASGRTPQDIINDMAEKKTEAEKKREAVFSSLTYLRSLT